VRPLALLLATACAVPAPPREYGVGIFAEDTVTARVSIAVTGTLQVTTTGESLTTGPDKTLTLGTPGSIVIKGGVGTATITSLDSGRRLAVVPTGLAEDSAEKATVMGTVVKLSRMGYEGARLRVEKP
jgi:hypothetical protein